MGGDAKARSRTPRTAGKRKRPRFRYVAFTMTPTVGRNALNDAFAAILQAREGQVGVQRLAPLMIKASAAGGIVRVERSGARTARETLAAIRWVGSRDRRVKLAPIATSGTLRGAGMALSRAARNRPVGSETI